MSALEQFDEANMPYTDKEWATAFLKVINDPRFRVFGLTLNDMLDVRFHLDCWNKTPQDLKKDVPQ